jgi:hypothetical protein
MKLKNVVLMIILSLSTKVFADTDLSIGQAFSAPVEAPASFKNLNLNFEKVVTDFTLDNGVLTATFDVNGSVCRYSAVLLADNENAKIKLVQSKAYALNNDVDCTNAKDLLDGLLIPNNDYLYYGHPHNIAIMVESSEAKDICGESATRFGINFVVSGKVQ